METNRSTTIRSVAIYWLPVALVAAGISIGSSLSGSRVDDVVDNTLKVVWSTSPNLLLFHLIEFAALTLLLYRLLSHHLRWTFSHLSIAILLLAGGYGAADELHQRYVPGRVASVSDIGADMLGVVIGLVLVRAALGLRQLMKQPAG